MEKTFTLKLTAYELVQILECTIPEEVAANHPDYVNDPSYQDSFKLKAKIQKAIKNATRTNPK